MEWELALFGYCGLIAWLYLAHLGEVRVWCGLEDMGNLGLYGEFIHR